VVSIQYPSTEECRHGGSMIKTYAGTVDKIVEGGILLKLSNQEMSKTKRTYGQMVDAFRTLKLDRMINITVQ
jgi:hypothetical protein